MNYGDKRYLE